MKHEDKLWRELCSQQIACSSFFLLADMATILSSTSSSWRGISHHLAGTMIQTDEIVIRYILIFD